MPKVHRSGPKSAVGMEFYDIEEIGAASFCQDSDDASTPATQVHMQIKLDSAVHGLVPMLVARFHGTDTLDAVILALIEHRHFVFGRRDWDTYKYPGQEEKL
jgi:hypothetical protein